MATPVTQPQFLLTYWNPFDKNNPGFIKSFLNYTKETNLAEYTGQIVGSFIEKANQQQIAALNNINHNIISGFNALNQKLALIQQELVNTNLLLTDIKELLKLPDSEKQRQRHIELGLKFSNASNKDDDLIKDAVNEFEQALSLMPQDWFVLYQTGMCYLYHEPCYDLVKAEEYFLKATKYGMIEDNFNQYQNHKNSFYLTHEKQKEDEDTYIKFLEEDEELDDRIIKEDPPSFGYRMPKFGIPSFYIIDSFLNAALINYINSDFEKATKYCKKAVDIAETAFNDGTINKEFYKKTLFFLSKYQARIKQFDNAKKNLSCIFEELGVYNIYEAIPGDLDLLTIPEISNFIESLKHQHDFILNKEKEENEKERLIYNAKNKIFAIDSIVYSYIYKLISERKPNLLKITKELEKDKTNVRLADRIKDTQESTTMLLFRMDVDKALDILKNELLTKNCHFRKNGTITPLIKTSDWLKEEFKNDPMIVDFLFRVDSFPMNEEFDLDKSTNKLIDKLPFPFNEQMIFEKYIEFGGFSFLTNKYKDIFHTFFLAKNNNEISTENNKKISNENNNKNKKCFIATATMGDIEHPVVKDLRLFRDNWLLKRKWGIKFTEWYYVHSPSVANLIQRSKWLRKIFLIILIKPLHLIARIVNK